MSDNFLKNMVRFINISTRANLMQDTFNELSDLYDTNPLAAEVKAKQILEDYIATLPEERQQRARAYNWRIQQELRKFKDPVARMNKMVEMFWDGVKDFQSALDGTHPSLILDQTGEPSVVKFPEKPQG